MRRSDDDKIFELTANYRIYCKCGHSMAIYPFEHREKKLCDHCGHYVYTKKGAFKEKLLKAMKENK